ncbi:type II toxin-antitoxin system Phd/YefM family antitoxin [Pontiellaceae bacterium B12219]|nr:type II toxin-antitoxin system Phd/YefM family antitoxin [Pontiellaceae bacterium B12219]
MSTITATNARKSFFELIKGVNQKHEIYHISHKDGAAVLMSEEEFESLQETLDLLSTKGFREDFDRANQEIEKGDTATFEEVFGEPQ